MNVLLQTLGRDGYVARPAKAPVGKVLPTRLTPRGRRRLARATVAVRAVEVRMLAGMTETEQSNASRIPQGMTTLESKGGVSTSFIKPWSGSLRAPVLYVSARPSAPSLHAWRPTVPGISEVLHAQFSDHLYPMHTHDSWTLLVVDSGTVRYDLDQREHATERLRVTLLPPHVGHDGRAASPGGFRKRVVYLDGATFDVRRVGRWVDQPSWTDTVLYRHTHLLHQALRHADDAFEAESRLSMVTERLARHLARLLSATTGRNPPCLRDGSRIFSTPTSSPGSRSCKRRRSWTRTRHLSFERFSERWVSRRTDTSPADGSTWPADAVERTQAGRSRRRSGLQ